MKSSLIKKEYKLIGKDKFNKMSDSLKGKKHNRPTLSEEHKNKISESVKGEKMIFLIKNIPMKH